MRIYTIGVPLILTAFMLPLTACGGGTQRSPDIEATGEARVQAELATGATIEALMKYELVKAMPTATVTPMPTVTACLLYTSPSPRDRTRSRMPSSA